MANRIEKLVQLLPPEIEAALISSETNRHYYTNFHSSAGTLLLTRQECFFIIDSRYYEAASAAIPQCTVLLENRVWQQVTEILNKQGIKSFAVESDSVTLEAYQQFQKQYNDFAILSDSRLSGLIRQQREIKTEEEVASIASAQKITDQTFTHILNFIRPGKTEVEIAAEMEYFSRKLGSEGPAFDFIVVSGKNSSKPHGVPSQKAVEAGDFITMDFGCKVDGYCSDMTRTVAVGSVSQKQRDVYHTVLQAQLAAMEKIRSGVPCKDIDACARNLIAAAGYGDCFGHGLGHSLGLEIHESPRFSPMSEAVCRSGHVMSVEPGIYLPGEFGVRIEDIVLITETGYRNFTQSTKELLVL